MNEPQQFQSWLVCQFCGRTTPRDKARLWLDEPHRHRPGYRIVRCPRHWSEWALRHTVVGRTNEMRRRMRDAWAEPKPAIPAALEPFPIMDREDQ